MNDAIRKLNAARGKADTVQDQRDNYRRYIDAKIADGWTSEDVAEYRAEVERIMSSGTEDEKAAAREFWKLYGGKI